MVQVKPRAKRIRTLPWQRLREFACSHGVRFRIVAASFFHAQEGAPVTLFSAAKATPRTIDYCPFSDALALRRTPKTLFISKDHLRDAQTLSGAIHELGHIIALRESTETCVEENDLGWEWRVANQIGLQRQWRIGMQSYVVASNDEYGHLSPVEKRATILAAIRVGKKYGNLTADGRPVAVR